MAKRNKKETDTQIETTETTKKPSPYARLDGIVKKIKNEIKVPCNRQDLILVVLGTMSDNKIADTYVANSDKRGKTVDEVFPE